MMPSPEIYKETLSSRIKGFLEDWVIVPGKIIVRNKKGLTGLIITLGFILLAVIGPMMIPEPRSFSCPIYEPPTILKWPPSFEHPLGCDYVGEDIFAQIVYGTPIVLEIAFIAGLLTTLIGIVVGMVAGFKGGMVDSVLMAITDIVMTIPGLPLIIVLSTVIRTYDPFTIGLLISIRWWTGLARSIRSQVLSIRQQDYIEAAKALGMRTHHIIFSEIMPNLMGFIAINFIFAAIGAIYASVGLYFLGILPFSTYNWGVMLNMAYKQAGALMTVKSLHYILSPIIAIILLQTGFIFLSYSLDEIFNPRLRTEIR
jgi:peptide/nickel transport system permease protein